MNTLSKFTNTQRIPFIDINKQSAEKLELDNQVKVFNLFQELVLEIRTVIESIHQPIARCACSHGKDSNLVVMATIEAYKQSIAAGLIEPNRPLLISHVDTLIESLPMQMFASYAKGLMEAYAIKLGINLIYSTISPPLSSEFFIKWGSADKMISNPSKTGDCSVILKISPALKLLATQRDTICKNRRVFTVTGQRLDESQRRADNMKKQKVHDRKAKDLLHEMDITPQHAMLNFAPIFGWKTSEVFTLLRIAGTDPVVKLVGKSIPTYYDNFALLLEIYGETTQETSEFTISNDGKINAPKRTQNQRFGCHFCTQIREDKSTAEISKKLYWKILGTENALRVRDWLFRLSYNLEAKTHQPKAIDPVLNRIMFQPNVLKARYLEKMIKYASQLTIDSLTESERFAALISQGKEDEHEGYAAIKNDANINPKAKKAFLAMYKSEASKPLMRYFSLEHAVYLSFKWAITGVASAGYTPLAIWANISEGVSRIPYPKLNAELPKERLKFKSHPALEPIVLPFHTKAFENKFLEEGQPSFTSFWEKPIGIEDMYDDVGGTSSIDNSADHTYKLKADFSLDIQHKPAIECEITTKIMPIIKTIKDAETKKILPSVVQTGLDTEIKAYITKKAFEILHVQHSETYLALAAAYKSNDTIEIIRLTALFAEKMAAFNSVSIPLRHFKPVEIETGFKKSPTKAEAGQRFTMRVTKRKNKKEFKFNKTTTRCIFYKPSTIPLLDQKIVSSTQIMVPDFSRTKRDTINTYNYLDDIEGDVDSIMINQDALNHWLDNNGHLEALAMYDSTIARNIKFRANYRKNYQEKGVRKYNTSEPIKRLMTQTGVIMIKPGYLKQYEAALKRSHLFSEIGAFQLQTLSRKNLLAHKGTITMAQHRKDKAEYLLKIRKIRNKNRTVLKADYAFFQREPVVFAKSIIGRTMKELFVIANDQVDLLNNIELGTYGAFGYSLDGVEGKVQKRTINTWFALYAPVLTDYDAFKTLLVSQNMKSVLTNGVLQEIKLSQQFQSLRSKLSEKISRANNLTENIRSMFTNLKPKEEMVTDQLITKIKIKEKNNALAALLSA